MDDDDEELEDEEAVVTLAPAVTDNERPHPEDDESITDDEIERFDQAARLRFEEELQQQRDQRYYDPKPGSPEAENAMRDMIRQGQPDITGYTGLGGMYMLQAFDALAHATGVSDRPAMRLIGKQPDLLPAQKYEPYPD